MSGAAAAMTTHRADHPRSFVRPPELLEALSPQCGFAPVAAGNEISWEDQVRKLELLVVTARQVYTR